MDRYMDTVIEYLRKGIALPPAYKEVLFPTPRKECELEYEGKMSKEEVLTDTDEVSDAPLRIERSFVPGSGDTVADWQNILIFGDNLQVLKALYYDADPLIRGRVRGKIKLIYIDPPFATEKEFNATVGQKAYADKVSGAEFVEFLRKRLIVMRELLAPDGFICVHLDYRKKHYIKVVMDEIFGENNFRNEIVVNRVKKSIRERRMVRKLNEEFDTILLYANSESAQLLPPTRAEKKEARWHAFDAPEVRSGMDYVLFGRKPNPNRHWTWEEPRARAAAENYARYERERRDGEGIDAYCERIGQKLDFLRPKATTGTPEYFISASDTVLCNNMWNDISAYSFANGYPTEKSEALLARIIGMTTSPGDLVMDCFAGSGTTLAVAEKMRRRWIGCDVGKLSLYTIQKRLLQISKSNDPVEPKRKYRKDAAAFCVATAGLYDLGKGFALSGDEYISFVKTLFEIEDTGKRDINGISIDGEKRGCYVKIYPYWDEKTRNAGIDRAYVEELHRRIGARIKNRFYIVAPADSVALGDDYYEIGGIKYYFLKIPYQVIRALRDAPFKTPGQPRSKKQGNDLTETIWFHFKRPLDVESRLVRDENGCRIEISGFRSDHGPDEDGRGSRGLESLALVLLDEAPLENSDRFIMTKFYDAKDLAKTSSRADIRDGNAPAAEKKEARTQPQTRERLLVPVSPDAKKVRAVYIDIFGNEFSETLEREEEAGERR